MQLTTQYNARFVISQTKMKISEIREAEKFGINQLFVAKNQKIEKIKCTITRFYNVYELLTLFN